MQQLIELLEENDVPEEADLIDQIDLDALLEANETTPDAVNFPLLNKFKRKSMIFSSLSLNGNILAFILQTTQEIEALQTNERSKNNLTLTKKQAIKDLKDRAELVMKPADKGRNVVVMTTDQYSQMCNRILKIRILSGFSGQIGKSSTRVQPIDLSSI